MSCMIIQQVLLVLSGMMEMLVTSSREGCRQKYPKAASQNWWNVYRGQISPVKQLNVHQIPSMKWQVYILHNI